MRARPGRTVIVAVAAIAAAAFALAPGTRAAAAQENPKPDARSAAPEAGQEAGQEPGQKAGEPVGQEIVRIEHANVEELPPVLRIFHVHAQAHPSLGILTLDGPADQVAAAAAAARELDVAPAPTPSLEVTVFVLGASKTRPLSGQVPPALEEVAHQLKDVFGFRGVDLIDSMSVRVLDRGRGGIQGILSAADGVPALPYRFGFNRATLVEREGTEPSVRLAGFQFEAATPHLLASLPSNLAHSETPAADFQTELATDLELRAGQTAVVGRAATAGGRDGLILVVRAQVVE